jgi:hypothetical protein
MELNIAGKTHELSFGFGFIRTLDEKFKLEQNGMKMGFGINMSYSLLDNLQPDALVDVIYAATKGVSKKDIEAFIEDYAEENGELEPLFDELKDEMGKSGMIKSTLKKFKQQIENGN